VWHPTATGYSAPRMLNGIAMAIQSLHPYSWDSVYKAAVLEPENLMLEQRIEVAQEVLLTRWLELTQRHGNIIEIRAIVEASEALRALKRQWLRKHRAA
jgi:hypothetical protein